MSRDRGYIYRRQKLRELPFVVEVPRPQGGVWHQLNDMQAWAQARCGADGYATTSREDRSGSGLPQTILRVHFGDEETARVFAAGFGVPYPPL
jgi:hypothetical protein